MGEYAEHPVTGRRIKLGTCECFYYATRGDLAALDAAGWRGDGGQKIADYLEERTIFCCLPKPGDIDGDADTIEAREPEFPNRYRITLEANALEALSVVDHYDLYLNHSKSGATFHVPCPLGSKWRGGPDIRQPARHIDLVAIGCGNGRAVYECPYCRAKFNLAGAPIQPVVLEAFIKQWCPGFGNDAPLMRHVYQSLVDAIKWAPEPANV